MRGECAQHVTTWSRGESASFYPELIHPATEDHDSGQDHDSSGGQLTSEETSWMTLDGDGQEEHAEHSHLRHRMKKEDDTPKREMMNLLVWAIPG